MVYKKFVCKKYWNGKVVVSEREFQEDTKVMESRSSEQRGRKELKRVKVRLWKTQKTERRRT